jgi:hypothetical protein
MGMFTRWIEGRFRSQVQSILRSSVEHFDDLERAMPGAVVSATYAEAWHLFGAMNHGKRPAVYREALADAAEYVAGKYAATAELLYGSASPD